MYTGESEGAMPKRGSGIEGRQTYVRYSAWHLVNSLNLVVWFWKLLTLAQENDILVSQQCTMTFIFMEIHQLCFK